jgi:hypothetical protein
MKMPRTLCLASVLTVIGGLADAQQASSPPGDAPQKATTSPSPDLVKRAKEAGFKPEVRNSVTVYCWKDADIGSRLPTKKCVGEDQLEIMLERRQAQRDAMRNNPAPGIKDH